MHWSEEIAQKIIERRPDKAEYVCAAGISPSGSIHIGNFRDVATSYFVVKSLQKLGKKARLLFSWDEFDRFRKVPVNVAAIDGDMEQFIGFPYVDVRNPFNDGCKSYADHFEQEFEASMRRFGIEMDYRYQAQMNRSGKYAKLVIKALQERGRIFDILDDFRTQAAAEGEREAYYPVSIYCPVCGRDTTKITSLTEDCEHATYTCACGHTGEFDFTRNFNCKLAWKIDWPMRWLYEEVDFEPGGKDHASPTGSYQTSKRISKEIFGYDAPIFQGYEFIGIKGSTGKMSGSSGLNLTPDTLLKIYEPEVILWLYSKTLPTKAFDFCFDSGILRQYFEFDKQYNAYRNGEADELNSLIMEKCLIEGHEISTVPMSLLAQMGSVVNFNVPMLETVFEKIGSPYKYDQFQGRLEKAKYWLEVCAPEDVYRLRTLRNWDVYEALTPEEQQEISMLHAYIQAGGYDLDTLNTKLYSIPKEIFPASCEDQKAIKKLQGDFFKTVYKLLIDKETGPRLYLFLFAIDPKDYVGLLDFSTPKTEAELAPPVEETAEEAEEVHGEPDPVAPFGEEVTLDAFTALDLRVCEIVKCSEIRKAQNNLKLTLFDGIGERVIVSSIKKYYKPEQLIGKKIIVIANLKPVRLTGVTSEGMLLAAANNACGCKVVFVDEAVPAGTKLC